MKNIIYAPSADSVAICRPSPRCMKALTHGGFGTSLTPEQRAVAEALTVKEHGKLIDNMVKDGHEADFSQRWSRAMVLGGETDATALDMIRVKDCRNGTNHMTGEETDVPTSERFFREAWRLRAGRIVVDLPAAKIVFAQRLIAAKQAEMKRLGGEIELAMLTGADATAQEAAYQAMTDMNLRALGGKVMAAGDLAALKALWPAAPWPAALRQVSLRKESLR